MRRTDDLYHEGLYNVHIPYSEPHIPEIIEIDATEVRQVIEICKHINPHCVINNHSGNYF